MESRIRGILLRALVLIIAVYVLPGCASRSVTDDGPGSEVNQGDRLGIIRFGSRVDTFVAMDATIRVKAGDRVHAGQTVLAQWDA